ncbi:hypothetical protein LPW11_08045 [Geomonas sp. RF6]|uniref:hypothetical protein n=1 Tax=Geomonas sp. RF6 TaxID=2897342 RepID=UPI001E43EA72|nr:hypothetical protein [Geomonas sp. RF6]UFS72130.1 hypothetical protein LPW11_08045 [Geomonas sp. RF6]
MAYGNGYGRLLAIALSWVCFSGCYLLLAGSKSPEEIVAAAAASSFLIFLVLHLKHPFKTPLRLKPSWLLLLLRIPWAMLEESWLLLFPLLRRLRGEEVEGVLLEHPFPPPRDYHDAARRAFMTFGVCVTPNSYLLLEDRERDTALVRQLVGKEISKVDRLFLELP